MVRIVSPELALVSACVLSCDEALARAARPMVGAGFDWSRAQALAQHHAVSAMAWTRLEQFAPGLAPAPVLQAARAEAMDNLALHTAQAHQTAHFSRLLERQGVRVVVLKGVPLARTLYPGNPEWRFSSDIDLLVDPADLQRADVSLRASGYRRILPAEDTTSQVSPTLFARFFKDFHYDSADGAHHLELHFRLTLNPHVFAIPFATLHADGADAETGFGTVRVIDGPLQLGYLAWHAMVDSDTNLKWLADVVWARRHLESRAEAIRPASLPGGVPHGPLALAMQVEALLMGEASCGGAGQAMRICRDMDRAQARQAARSFAQLPRDLSLWWFRMQMANGWRARAWFVWWSLVDPRDAISLGGRSFPAIVYALAGPLLAMWRYVRRRVPTA